MSNDGLLKESPNRKLSAASNATWHVKSSAISAVRKRQRLRPWAPLDQHRSINALAETINGLYKAEVIWRQRSWPGASAVDMATLRWVDWFNNHRLFGPIGYIPPVEAETNYYAGPENLNRAA
jgi:transposase InsO family protein